MSAETSEYGKMKHVLLRGGGVTRQVLASVKSAEQALSAETFFSPQNATSTGFDKF